MQSFDDDDLDPFTIAMTPAQKVLAKRVAKHNNPAPAQAPDPGPPLTITGTQLIHGECLSTLRRIPDHTFDALVTDPPAGIAFMGLNWDKNKGHRDEWIAWLAEIMQEVWRVLKPGACGLVWSLPRTSHWTGMALENAGFVVVDIVSHLYGQGMPKSKSLLKPAHEDWWLVRKPGPLQELNIDACRVGTSKPDPQIPNLDKSKAGYGGFKSGISSSHSCMDTTTGRWPPNLILSHGPDCVRVGERQVQGQRPPARGAGLISGTGDENGIETVEDWQCAENCPIVIIGEQSGYSRSTIIDPKTKCSGASRIGTFKIRDRTGEARPSSLYKGLASRYFTCLSADMDTFLYCPKASTGERMDGGPDDDTMHPTMKPIALMRWLCKLITPKNGLILDPFAGSGTTIVAAIEDGFQCVGIEQEEVYVKIAQARKDLALKKKRSGLSYLFPDLKL